MPLLTQAPVKFTAVRHCDFVCCLLLLATAGCHATESATVPVRDDEPIKADRHTAPALTVRPSVWPTTVRTQGTLVADERAVIGSKVSGRVAETMVDLGSIVKRGEPLVRLDPVDFELHVERANAQLAEACAAVGLEVSSDTRSLDSESIPFVQVEKAIWQEASDALARLRKLHEKNAVSQAELDKQVALTRVANARYEAALRTVDENLALIQSRRAELAQVKQELKDATICAPFDGVVQQRHLAAGTFVQPGTPVATVVRIDPLRFQGRVPERKATLIRVGQAIRIHIEGNPEMINSRVVRTSPSLDPSSRSLQIEAEVSNPKSVHRAGLFAEGYVEVDATATTLSLPENAVGEFAGVHKVWFVKEDNHIGIRTVEIGRRLPQRLEIVSGLAEGDRVLEQFTDGDHRNSELLTRHE